MGVVRVVDVDQVRLNGSQHVLDDPDRVRVHGDRAVDQPTPVKSRAQHRGSGLGLVGAGFEIARAVLAAGHHQHVHIVACGDVRRQTAPTGKLQVVRVCSDSQYRPHDGPPPVFRFTDVRKT